MKQTLYISNYILLTKKKTQKQKSCISLCASPHSPPTVVSNNGDCLNDFLMYPIL